MKNFDEGRSTKAEQDRTFVLRGETFVVKPSIHPDVLLTWDEIEPTSGVADTMDKVDLMFTEMIDPRDDALARYSKVRERKDDPVDVATILDVLKWMLEVASGRPTGQPDDSSSGQTSTGTASTVVSSSQDTSTESAG